MFFSVRSPLKMEKRIDLERTLTSMMKKGTGFQTTDRSEGGRK